MTITSIQYCMDRISDSNYTCADQAADYFVLNYHTKMDNMDPATFDKVYDNLKKQGWGLRTSGDVNVMTLAALKGNSILIRHLYKLDPTLINFGNRAGQSPLFVAVENEKIEVAEALIELGANTNLALPYQINMSPNEIIPYGATCLWVALERIKSVFWAKLLLRRGGVNHLPLSEEGQQIVNKAQEELAEERILIAAGIEQSHQHFPTELLKIIYTYF